jgi:hypothetical protein
VVIVAAVGQTILTTAGMLSGWISSIVSVSAPLMGRRTGWLTTGISREELKPMVEQDYAQLSYAACTIGC